MSLSEEARLELMRMTLDFAADNFEFSQSGPAIARHIRECYLVLHEALSFDGLPSAPREVRHGFLSRLRQRPLSFFGSRHKGVGLLEKVLVRCLGATFSQKACDSGNCLHSFKRTHSSSPSEFSKMPASDSHSEVGHRTVAYPTQNQKETRV